MNNKEISKIVTPELFFRGLKILLETRKPIGSKDGSIMADALWPTGGPENKDEIGEDLLDCYFSKNYSKTILNLPHTKNKDALELEEKASEIVRRLIAFVDELCYTDNIRLNTIKEIERPFNWFIEGFIKSASSIDWVKIESNVDNEIVILPLRKFCKGFEASGIRNIVKRKIGF